MPLFSALSPSALAEYRYFGFLRFGLAVLVMVQHFACNLAPAGIVAAVYPYGMGTVAVLVFFVLSGFIITEAVHCYYTGRPGAYLVNRCLRIIPPYFVALLLTVLVHAALLAGGNLVDLEGQRLDSDIFSVPSLLANMAGFLPAMRTLDFLPEYTFIPYIWAVRAEFLFYLAVFAGMCLAVAGKGRTSQPGALALVTIPFFGLYGLFLAGKAPDLFAFVPFFALGGALFFYLAGYKKSLAFILAASAGIAAYFLRKYHHPPETLYPIDVAAQGMLFTGLVLVTALLSVRPPRVGEKTDRFLGELSYSLYLNHYVVGVALRSLFPQPSVGVMLAGYGIAIALSAGLYYLIEPPLKKWRNRVRGKPL